MELSQETVKVIDNEANEYAEQSSGLVISEVAYRIGATVWAAKYEAAQKRADELQAENERLSKRVRLCTSYINGALDGLDLDNSCDVIEKSFIVKELQEIKSLLNNQQ